MKTKMIFKNKGLIKPIILHTINDTFIVCSLENDTMCYAEFLRDDQAIKYANKIYNKEYQQHFNEIPEAPLSGNNFCIYNLKGY